jgi:hypothetical protein
MTKQRHRGDTVKEPKYYKEIICLLDRNFYDALEKYRVSRLEKGLPTPETMNDFCMMLIPIGAKTLREQEEKTDAANSLIVPATLNQVGNYVGKRTTA